MASEVNSFTDILWHRGVWLPPNTTWEQIEEPGRAQFSHLAYPLPLAFLMMVLRFFLDRGLYRYVLQCEVGQINGFDLRPIGRALGIKDKRKRSPEPNPTLEAAFQCGSRRVDYKSLVTDTGMSDRQINVWMRMRNLAGK